VSPTLATSSAAPLPEPSACGIRAFSNVEVARGQIRTLRKNPGPADGFAVPANVLKYADDQTVVALAAVLQAIRAGGMQGQKFTDWGVVAAPCFLGRTNLVGAFEKFRRQGAPGVSPLITPFLSLHAVAATISLALQVHGPNLGVGGSKGNMVEALLTGLVVQRGHNLPGLWLVFSEWDPEPMADTSPEEADRAICRAVSLGLVPLAADWQGPRLVVVPGAPASFEAVSVGFGVPAEPTMRDLAYFLANSSGPAVTEAWTCPWGWNGRLEVWRPAGSAASHPASARAA
jgi:hypothetical protein